MAIEKFWAPVPPQPITTNGTADGHISVSDSTLFYVKRKVNVFSNAVSVMQLEVKKINNINDIELGPIGNINLRSNLTAILTADSPIISAPDFQNRPAISVEDVLRASFANEPAVGLRSLLIDSLGNPYKKSNPMPVQLSDGDINIETLNAELRVQLSAKDDDPTAGDVHSSVRIGDQNYEAEITAARELKVTDSGSHADMAQLDADLLAFKAANHADLVQIDTDLLAFKSANHVDLVAIFSGLGSVDSDLLAFKAANHTDLLSIVSTLGTPMQQTGGTVTANQGGSWSVASTQSGAWTTGRTWTLSSGTDAVNVGNFPSSFAVTQGTSPWIVDASGFTVPISAVSLPLPTGASSAANQLTAIASLASIDSKLTSPITVTGPLTNAQLRATPVPISGTVSLAVESIEIGTVDQGTGGSSAWKVDGSAVTQPISAAALPLPAGASTSALQISGNASLASIDSKLMSPLSVTGPLTDAQLRATPVPISGTVSLVVESIEIGTVDQGTGGSSAWKVDGSAVTQPISAAALPLPAGASTSALQTAGNISLASIDTKLTTTNSNLSTINSTLGSPFQAGGSIGNTSFAVTQATAANLNATVVGPAGAALAKDSSLTTINATLGTPMQQTGGSVTANAGTNLNTSLLALESGGHLASIDTKIPSGLTVVSTRLLVDGSGVTQPISGTIAATQSGTWNTGRTWTLASGTDSVAAVQSGTWTIQPGNTANTTPWLVTDSSDGSVAPGTVASKSSLAGGQYNSGGVTLTNGQQSALQVDSSGKLLISGALTFSQDQDYGVVGASTLRTAAQIGNAAGAAAFGAGTTSAQVLRVVLPTDQSAIPALQSGAWSVTSNQGTSPWITSNSDITETFSFTALNQTLDVVCTGKAVVRFQLSNTWDGEISYFQSTDGINFDPSPLVIDASQPYSNSNSLTPSTIVNVTALVEVTGCVIFRLKATTWTSGTADVTAIASAHQSIIFNAGSTKVYGEVYVDQNSTPWLCDVSSFGGNPVVTGTGSGGAGIPRVTVSDDSSMAVLQSGPWNVSLNAGGNTIGNVNQGNSGSQAWKVDGSAVVQPVSGTFWQATQPISAAALPLPSGAATSALQTTGNTSVASIDTKTPVLGQALAAASVPVVLTAAQLTTLTPLSSVAVTNIGTFAVQATLTAETTKVIGTVNISASQTVGLVAGSAVIGHVITDSGSTTAVTGNVASTIADGADVTLGSKADAKSTATDTTAITIMQVLKQISASVQAPPSQAVTNAGTFVTQSTLAAETTKVIGTVNIAASQTIGIAAGSAVIGHVIIDSGSTTAVTGNVASTIADGADVTLGSKADAKSTATDTTAVTIMQVLKQISASSQAPPSSAVTNTGTFAVQATATLAAETTKVIGTVNIAASQTVGISAGSAVIGHVIIDSGSTTAVTGNVASTIADGADVTLGSKADAKSTATDTTAVTIMQVLKQISASSQAPPSSAVTNTGTFAVQSTLQANSGVDIGKLTANQSVNVAQVNGVTTLMGNGTTGTGSQRVTIASDNTAFSVNATPPTLTKGTQGSTGYSVQDLKDSGRTALIFYATNVAAGLTTVETAISLTKASGTSATSSAASFVVTNGKRFRITNITVATRGNAVATTQSTIFNLRVNTAGAVTTSSTPIVLSVRSASPATASAYDRFTLEIPDGYEISGDGTLQFGLTAAATYVTTGPTWDATIVGYEY